MRATIELDDALLEQARRSSGVEEENQLLHLALEALVAQQKNSPEQVISLPVWHGGGLMPGFASLEEAIEQANLEADWKVAYGCGLVGREYPDASVQR